MLYGLWEREGIYGTLFAQSANHFRPLTRYFRMVIALPLSGRRKKSDGSILELGDVISLRYAFYGGWRNVKILTPCECRKILDCASSV